MWGHFGPLDRAVSATPHKFPINGFLGPETTMSRTSDCHHRLEPRRPRRLGIVGGRAARMVCASHSAVEWAWLRTHALQDLRLDPPSSTNRPCCRCCAVRGSGKRSRVPRSANTWVISASVANGHPCGPVSAAPALHRSAKLPWARVAAFSLMVLHVAFCKQSVTALRPHAASCRWVVRGVSAVDQSDTPT